MNEHDFCRLLYKDVREEFIDVQGTKGREMLKGMTCYKTKWFSGKLWFHVELPNLPKYVNMSYRFDLYAHCAWDAKQKVIVQIQMQLDGWLERDMMDAIDDLPARF